jgi:hypothetical protein
MRFEIATLAADWSPKAGLFFHCNAGVTAESLVAVAPDVDWSAEKLRLEPAPRVRKIARREYLRSQH